jgi:hypothetical protein
MQSVTNMAATTAAAASALTDEEVAAHLVGQGLWLTALELHAELCEAGRPLPSLAALFADLANFQPTSAAVAPGPRAPLPRRAVSPPSGLAASAPAAADMPEDDALSLSRVSATESQDLAREREERIAGADPARGRAWCVPALR